MTDENSEVVASLWPSQLYIMCERVRQSVHAEHTACWAHGHSQRYFEKQNMGLRNSVEKLCLSQGPNIMQTCEDYDCGETHVLDFL
jgi:hypothetical protein